MRLKKSKQEILQEFDKMINPYMNAYNMGDVSPSHLKNLIESAIKDTAHATLCLLLDNIYTDEEFEQDLNLKS